MKKLLGISLIAILLMASCAPAHKKAVKITVTTDSTVVDSDSISVDSASVDSVVEQ